jgi:hypothetical protein
MVAALAMWAFSAPSSPVTLRVVEHADTDAVTDTGAKGDSVGDVLTFANRVFNANNSKQIGTDNGHCLRTVVGQAWECFWTLTVEGPFYDTKDSVLAITGGTGAYRGAKGEMSLHVRNAKGTEYDFVYRILK